MTLQIDQLTAFERVAREASFSRAATALGIGQPAVSARIQALEAALGGPLFVRGRRIGLTPLGDGFLPRARRILEMVDEGVHAARRGLAGGRGAVRLGVLGSLAGGLVGPALAEVVRAHPDLDCSVRSADHEFLLELMMDGAIELALVTWPCATPAALRLAPLLRLHEPVVLVAHPKHALARRRTVAIADLPRLARPLLRLRWWQTHHPEITRLAELSGTTVEAPKETARRMVTDGVGAGFFTRTYVADDLARGTLRAIRVAGLPRLYRDSALVRRDRPEPLSPAAALIVDAIGAHARRLRLLA